MRITSRDVHEKESRRFVPERSSNIYSVAFSGDGATLAVRYQNAGIGFWDMESGEKWRDLPREKAGSGKGLRFSPDGTMLAMAAEMQPAGIRLWDVSGRPGASSAAPRLPPALGDAAPLRDDLLIQTIERAIRGTFDRRNVGPLTVELLPDGALRLTGQVSGESIKEIAGRTAATQTVQGEMISEPRRIVNELEVAGGLFQ